MDALQRKAQIVKDVVKPAFKRAGFRAAGLTFTKEEAGFVKLFNVQASVFNSSERAALYFNLGLYFPVAAWFWLKTPDGKPVPPPKAVKETDCQLRFRSCELSQTPDGYLIDQDTDQLALTGLIAKDLTDVILPFFDAVKTLDDCLTTVARIPRHMGIGPLVPVALTHASLGHMEEAARLLRAHLRDETLPASWREAVIAQARAHNLEL